MIHILGRDEIPQFKCFDHVKKCLEQYFSEDIYLGAFSANYLNIDLKGKVVYNMEYLHKDNPLWKTGYEDILRNNIVVDFSRTNIEYLEKLGIKATYLPFGIDDSMKNVSHVDKKDIDVLFIGSTHFDRRQHIINELKQKCNVVVAEGVYGTELDSLIGRTKVHINIHHAEGQPLETVRINYLLANNCTVVSEYGSDEKLNELYEDSLMFTTYDSFVDSCLHSLQTYNQHKEIVINNEVLQKSIKLIFKE